MASNLFICSLFSFLICSWNINSVDGLSLEDRLQQLTDNYVTNFTFFLSLVTTSLKLISLLKKKGRDKINSARQNCPTGNERREVGGPRTKNSTARKSEFYYVIFFLINCDGVTDIVTYYIPISMKSEKVCQSKCPSWSPKCNNNNGF